MTVLRCLMTTVLLAGCLCSATAANNQRPNLLIITVDDMSADSLGVFGCPLAETSPHIDRLGAESLRFTMAHVQVGNCMPSRNVMWSGRYPHNNGVEGFYQVRNPGYPVLCDLMKQAGYLTAIRHKVSHSTPYSPYQWDVNLDTASDGSRPHAKDPASYGVSTRQGIAAADAQNKPFCLMINIADPHKPFFAEGNRGQTVPDPHVPSRVFAPEETPIPGFLFDDPVVHKELAHYYSSVRRADDAVGQILAALQESGRSPNTLVMFLSDHGMPLPFAKTQLYHHSTHTPLMIRWPGVTRPGSVDDQHMVSAVDFLPTLLDVCGIDHPADMDGRSFAPLLHGEQQTGRDSVFKEYNENAGGSRDPMRAVQTPRFLYLFNPWSNGTRVMATATNGTSTYRRMAELAKLDDAIRFRHDVYQHRVLEELFDVQQDPSCLHNLIDSPDHLAVADELRGRLELWMQQTSDPMLAVFQKRSDAEFREAYILQQEAEADARHPKTRPKNNPNAPGTRRKNLPGNDNAQRPPAAGRAADLIRLNVPELVPAGQPLTVTIDHHLTETHGKQRLHVTLKGGREQKRLDRQVVTISGEGTAKIRFDIPASVPDNTLSIAAFIGNDFPTNLQHVQSSLLPIMIGIIPKAAADRGTRPNLIIINIDDLGYADIGPFGCRRHKTPSLDRMANEGRRLTCFYAAPVCSPSRASLMTGSYAKRALPIPHVLFPENSVGLHPDEITIAELLKAEGYATGIIGKWHLGDQPEFLPTRQGFDYYFGLPYSNDMGPAADGIKSNLGAPLPGTARKQQQPPLPLMRNETVIARIRQQEHTELVTGYTSEAIQFIRQHREQPFFLYLPHSAVHFPLYPGEKFQGHSGNGLYSDWTEEVDWSVGQVLEAVRDLDLAGHTFVLFMSDNGGSLRHGAVNEPLKGGKGSTWEGGMRVPTIAWWPGKIPAGSSTDEVCGMMDLLPTLTKLAGGQVPADRTLDGFDIWPLLTSDAAKSPHDVYYFFRGLNLEAVRKGHWKLHLAKTELYNLHTDLSESTSVATDHPDVVRELTQLAESMNNDLGTTEIGPGCRPLGKVSNGLPLINRDGSIREGFAPGP